MCRPPTLNKPGAPTATRAQSASAKRDPRECRVENRCPIFGIWCILNRMSTPTTRDSEPPTGTTNTNALNTEVRASVDALAQTALTRDEFLQSLAGQLGQWLTAALVAVHDAGWGQARMLVHHETIAAGIDRAELTDRLASAGVSVSSIQMTCRSDAQLVMAGQPTQTYAGLTVELLPAPQRCSLVIVRDSDGDSSSLLLAMETLNECVAAVRESRFASTASTSQSSVVKPEGISTSGEIAPVQHTDNRLDQLAAVRQSLRRFHKTLDPTATAYQIASELPRLLPCERAVVLMTANRGRRRKYKVTAISGSAVVDRRSPLVRTMNRLADKIAVMDTAIILPTQEDATNRLPHQSDAGIPSAMLGDSHPPQVLGPLEDYLDESGVLSVVVLPIDENAAEDEVDDPITDIPIATTKRSMPLAIILLETFTGEPSRRITPAMQEICLEASAAITNAMRYDDVFALPLRRPLAGLSRSTIRNWAAALLVVMIGLAVAAFFVRVDHHVVASGVARPSERKAIFSTVDGIVRSIEVQDGDRISAGETLIRLESVEIQRESQSLSGQLATTTSKLASLRSMHLAGADDPRESAQNIIEQRTLESELATISDQIKINEAMQEDLTIRAPMDGVVVGWRLAEKLQSRPVTRGDRLLAMIAPEGDWELDLRLDETKAGEVMQRVQNGETLPITFAIQTRPTETMQAQVQHVGGIARRDTDGMNVIDVVAAIDRDSLSFFQNEGFRGDADVTAKIICGRRRLISSWSEELVAWFHRNVLFPFSIKV